MTHDDQKDASHIVHVCTSVVQKMRRWLANIRLNIECVNGVHRFERIETSIVGVVFSRDRPMQLEALIDSYFECSSDAAMLFVIYKTSSSLYERGYDVVKARHAAMPISWVAEQCFYSDLIQVLRCAANGKVFFLVDDIIFVRRFCLGDFSRWNTSRAIPSMRLGTNITRSYTDNMEIGKPALSRIGSSSFFKWNQWCGRGEWGYPFSVDGNIYSAREVRELASRLSFTSPNSFEAQMNRYKWALKARYGVCAEYPVLINIAANRVQREIDNRSGSISVAEMATALLDGWLIDWKVFLGIKVSATHCELPLQYRRLK